MKSRVLVLFAVMLMLCSSSVFADELILEFDPDEELTTEDLADEVESEEVIQPPQASVRDSYLAGYQQLFQLNADEVAGLEAVLIPVREDVSTLDTQLQVIGLQIQRMQQVEGLIRQKMIELQELDNKLRVQEQLLSLEMKNVLKKFERTLVLFFQIKRQYVHEDGTVNLLQLFLSSPAPSDMLFQDVLLGRIQDQLLEQMQFVSVQQFQLSRLRNSVLSVQEQLNLYQERIQESGTILAQQTLFKEQLLLEKRDEQRFFEIALQEAKEEQLVILERVQEIATGVSNREYREFPKESFIWSVAPTLGISAYYKDQAYKSRFGLDHNAIDIPTDQLTSVKAPMSGKVLEVHDGGLGYSYLQLGHRDGFSTVYGHLYSFKVQKGDVVRQGQVIALSGGASGTKGSGRLTTGPHLHFELLKQGEHVDPLLYLPDLEG